MDIATTVTPAFELIQLPVLTDKGVAVSAAYHLLAALRVLTVAEREDVLELLSLEMAEQLG